MALKLLVRTQAQNILELRTSGLKMNRTVLVTGNFNVLHPGHIRLLKFAKSFEMKLIVGVNSDKIAGSLVDSSEILRKEAVSSINIVDECFLVDGPIHEFIKRHKPAIIVKGKEYEKKQNPEMQALKEFGGQLIFSSGEIGSTGDASARIDTDKLANTRIAISNFMRKHEIKKGRLLRILSNFSNKKVCIIGDLIVDEYVDCFPLGMSREEPCIVVSPQETKRFLGGAAIVAAHSSALGAKANFLSVTGNDEVRDFAASNLENFDVDYKFIIDHVRPTTVKQRYRSLERSLLKVTKLSQQPISENLQNLMFKEFKSAAEDADLIVFSDFNYGCLPQPLVRKISKFAQSQHIMIAADCQSSSQYGDISRYHGANLITPTEHEARVALHNYDDGLVVLADKLMKKTSSENILLKLGPDGLIAQCQSETSNAPHTEKLDALNSNPKDVSGAGDSMLATASLAMISGANLWEASLLGNIAAFLQVGRLGNVPIQSEEILEIVS